MFESIVNFFKRFGKNEKENSKTTAKERLHLVLAQDRANISADFLEMMKQEIIEVIKKYIDIDEEAIDVRMTNKPGEDGTMGAPALYANIPIVTIKNEARKLEGTIKEKQIEQNKEIASNEKNENTESTVEEKSTKPLEAKEEQDKKEPKEEAIEEKNDKLEENSENKQKEIKKVENKVEKSKEQKQASEKGNEKKATSNHNNKKRKKNK